MSGIYDSFTVRRGDGATVTESGRAVIRCRFYGPTNTRGSRIGVRRFDPPCAGNDPNRITVSWDYGLSVADNYVAAVREYVTRADWAGSWVVSTVTDGAVAVYVPGSMVAS